MKNLLSIIAILVFTTALSAQRKQPMSDWTAGIDSIASEEQLKNILFSFSTGDTITVDRKPSTLTVDKKHRPVTHDNRIVIPAGTPGRIVEIKFTTDSIPDPNVEVGMPKKFLYRKTKFYLVRFEKDKQVLATLLFSFGSHPDRDTPCGVAINRTNNSFTYDGHFYELAIGSGTLQVPKKVLDDFKIATGYKF
jgi:hypothetical protein